MNILDFTDKLKSINSALLKAYGISVSPEAYNKIKNILSIPGDPKFFTATPLDKLASLSIAVDGEQEEDVKIYYDEFSWKAKLELLGFKK